MTHRSRSCRQVYIMRECHRLAWCFLVGVLTLLAFPGFAGAATRSPESRAPHPSGVRDRVCISLRVLAAEAQKRPPNQEVEHLAGIGWFEAFVVDKDNHDVILVGRRTPNWPSLHLDDLVVGLRNVWTNASHPYCSLDPLPKDVLELNKLMSNTRVVTSVDEMHEVFARLKDGWGPQSVVVGGVPRNSRYAHVMIDADYHMKKVSQGLVQLGGVRSCLDIVIDRSGKIFAETGRVPPVALSMSRFWFHFGEGQPTFQEGDNIVRLDKCSVVLLTEKQRAAVDGTLSDSGEDDQNASAFAREFSEHFKETTSLAREYADLENLFRLTAILKAMHVKDAAGCAGLDLGFFIESYECRGETAMPASLPGLANAKEARGEITKGKVRHRYVLLPMVSGGVSMELTLDARRFARTDGRKVNLLRKLVVDSRPDPSALSWRLPPASD